MKKATLFLFVAFAFAIASCNHVKNDEISEEVTEQVADSLDINPDLINIVEVE